MADPFQPKFVDLVRNTTSTTGTGNFNLGPAVSGYTSFTAALQVGDCFYYSVIGIDKPQEREVGRGALLAGGQISRDPISGAKINFTPGTKSIALIAAAEWFQAAQQLMAVVSPFGQALASASTAALARSTLGLGLASMLDGDADALLSANSDTKVPTQKAVKTYVDAHQPTGSLLATNNLSDVASASSARSNLGIGSAAVETVSRFPVTLADRAALSAYSATSTAYLRENGREGLFVWDGSNQSANVAADSGRGIYVAAAADPTGASGAWVRKYSGAPSVKWFGAKGDGTTDDSAAFVAAIALVKAIGVNPVGNQLASDRLFIPAGHYYLGTTTLDITHTLIIEGCGTGFDGAQPARLRWAAGTTGIRVQRYNTSGASAVDGPHNGGDGTILRGLYLQGAYSGTEAEAHAIHLKARAAVENCLIIDFQGDGIYANDTAGSGGAGEGNANNCRISDNTILRCRNGIYIDGADTNIWEVRGNDTSQHRRWGVYDSSFLGNHYSAHHAAGNGVTVGATPTIVIYSGNQYCARKNGTWTNAPSGTTADTADWYYMGAGLANAGLNIAAWSNAITYRDGGSYRGDGEGNAYNVFSVYAELGQGYAQIDGPALVWGAIKGQVRGIGTINGSPTGLYSSNGFVTDGNVKGLGNFSELGPQSGTAADSVLTLHNSNSRSDIFFRQSGTLRGFCSAVGATMAIGSQSGQTDLYANAAAILSVKTGGADLASGKTLSLNGATVIDSSRNGVFAGITATGGIASSGGGIGYATGAGGAVTQATSKSTGVTLNKLCGQVTMNAAALPASAGVSFTVTNSQVAATDTIDLVLASGNATAGTYNYQVDKLSAGSFIIWVKNISGGSLAEALVFNFSVKKAVNA